MGVTVASTKTPSSSASRPVVVRSTKRASVVRAASRIDESVTRLIDVSKQMVIVGIASATIICAPHVALADSCPTMVKAPSGLEYCDEKVGEGDPPVKGAFVKVHYQGRLDSEIASGTFDSSYDRGKPLGFSIGTGQVISGWDLGILGDGEKIPAMRPGGKRKLVIPSELGYGKRGAGGVIPPNATLYFDVEYLGRLGAKK